MGNEGTPISGIRKDTPKWLKRHVVGKGVLEFDDKTYTYFIVSRLLEPNLPGFVGFPGGKTLFISEEVPEEFRPYMLWHEIQEQAESPSQMGKCLITLVGELDRVPSEMKQRYIDYRRRFFQNFAAYLQNSEDQSFRAEIGASLVHLQSI